jgi:hypothetical protein
VKVTVQFFSFLRPMVGQNELALDVPDGATADHFLPVAVELAPNWLPNTLTGNSTLTGVNASVMSMPTDVNFIDPLLDGYSMGFLGAFPGTILSPIFSPHRMPFILISRTRALAPRSRSPTA